MTGIVEPGSLILNRKVLRDCNTDAQTHIFVERRLPTTGFTHLAAPGDRLSLKIILQGATLDKIQR